jgi:hypothetical protein
MILTGKVPHAPGKDSVGEASAAPIRAISQPPGRSLALLSSVRYLLVTVQASVRMYGKTTFQLSRAYS